LHLEFKCTLNKYSKYGAWSYLTRNEQQESTTFVRTQDRARQLIFGVLQVAKWDLCVSAPPVDAQLDWDEQSVL